MSLLRDFLRNGGTISELQERYAIKSTRHREFSNLVLFKYNQIDSPFVEPIVREARGIILDEADDWRVVSRSFDKFFNYGEGLAAKIDWSSARVEEKVDGSLCVLYWYKDAWRVQTSGMPDAVGEVNGLGFSFAELFWKTWNEMGLELPRSQEVAYSFELTAPWNRVVVPHKEAKLTFLAARHIETGVDFNSSFDWELSWPCVQSFSLSSFDSILETFKTMDPLHQEGYVVVDAFENRVKVKHPGCVAIHHLRDGFGPKRLLEVIRTGEATEFLTYYPEWCEKFENIKNKYESLVSSVETDYERLRDISVQKDFAIEAMKTRCSGALFRLRAGKVDSVRQHFAFMPIGSLMELVDVKDEALTVE